MTIDIERLSELEISARMICEAPLCHGPALYRAKYTFALENERDRTFEELMCTGHMFELLDELRRAATLRALGHYKALTLRAG